MGGPHFLVIGAQKAGTSWLANMLRRHPEIYAPQHKELHFFNKHYDRGINWYEAQFKEGEQARALGEFTPNYLWTLSHFEDAAENERNFRIPALVKQHYPAIKLIVSLRDPVQRAISAHLMNIRFRHLSPLSRISRVGHRFGIFDMGYYFENLSRWLQFFPRNQFLFLIYEEDIAQNRGQTLRRAFQFLGVDPTFDPGEVDTRYHRTPGHFYLYLNYYFPRLAPALARRWPAVLRFSRPRIRISEAERRQLEARYRPSNRQLERLLNRKLPWL